MTAWRKELCGECQLEWCFCWYWLLPWWLSLSTAAARERELQVSIGFFSKYWVCRCSIPWQYYHHPTYLWIMEQRRGRLWIRQALPSMEMWLTQSMGCVSHYFPVSLLAMSKFTLSPQLRLILMSMKLLTTTLTPVKKSLLWKFPLIKAPLLFTAISTPHILPTVQWRIPTLILGNGNPRHIWLLIRHILNFFGLWTIEFCHAIISNYITSTHYT